MSTMTVKLVAKLFDFEGHSVRVEVDDEGNHWFNARDVGDCVGLTQQAVSKRVARLDDDEVSTTFGCAGKGGSPSLWISRSGVFDFVGSSSKPAARRFRRWLRREVLESIADTGRYELQPRTPEEVLAEAVLLSQSIIEAKTAENRALEAENRRLRPAADYGRRIAALPGETCIKTACKALNLKAAGPDSVFAWLKAAGHLIFRDGVWQPSAPMKNAGRFVLRIWLNHEAPDACRHR